MARAYRADGKVSYGAAITDAGRIAIGADIAVATDPAKVPPVGAVAPNVAAIAPGGVAAKDGPAPTKTAQILSPLRRADGTASPNWSPPPAGCHTPPGQH